MQASLKILCTPLWGGGSWKVAETQKNGIFVVGSNKCHQMGELIQTYNATLYWKDLLFASCGVIQKVRHSSAGISEKANLWEGDAIGLKCDFTQMRLLNSSPCFLVTLPLITWSWLLFYSLLTLILYLSFLPSFQPLFPSSTTFCVCEREFSKQI